MESLWQSTWRRWLDARSRRGIDHLTDHLRRDIGVDDPAVLARDGDDSPESIRTSMFSGGRSFSLLHE